MTGVTAAAATGAFVLFMGAMQAGQFIAQEANDLVTQTGDWTTVIGAGGGIAAAAVLFGVVLKALRTLMTANNESLTALTAQVKMQAEHIERLENHAEARDARITQLVDVLRTKGVEIPPPPTLE